MNVYSAEMIMNDTIEIIGKNTLIQQGKHNDRVYLMKLDKQDADLIPQELTQLALEKRYGKIFCKIPKVAAPLFFAQGYMLEAYIPNFYSGVDDVFFVSKFLNSDRLLNIEQGKLTALSGLLNEKLINKEANTEYQIRKLGYSDLESLCNIYKEIFQSYPFPIHDTEYLKETMDDNVQYYGAFLNNNLAAVASSEIDFKGQNAEMTDFATSAAHLGNNLSIILLDTMEKAMKAQGLKTLYTIARLNSIPMNKTFLRAGYTYSGTLIKNTNIAGKIESMNVLYKHI